MITRRETQNKLRNNRDRGLDLNRFLDENTRLKINVWLKTYQNQPFNPDVFRSAQFVDLQPLFMYSLFGLRRRKMVTVSQGHTFQIKFFSLAEDRFWVWNQVTKNNEKNKKQPDKNHTH